MSTFQRSDELSGAPPPLGPLWSQWLWVGNPTPQKPLAPWAQPTEALCPQPHTAALDTAGEQGPIGLNNGDLLPLKGLRPGLTCACISISSLRNLCNVTLYMNRLPSAFLFLLTFRLLSMFFLLKQPCKEHL